MMESTMENKKKNLKSRPIIGVVYIPNKIYIPSPDDIRSDIDVVGQFYADEEEDNEKTDCKTT